MRDEAAGAHRELKLEIIQSDMAQKPMLRGEVGARVRDTRVWSETRVEAWAGAVVQGAWMGGYWC